MPAAISPRTRSSAAENSQAASIPSSLTPPSRRNKHTEQKPMKMGPSSSSNEETYISEITEIETDTVVADASAGFLESEDNNDEDDDMQDVSAPSSASSAAKRTSVGALSTHADASTGSSEVFDARSSALDKQDVSMSDEPVQSGTLAVVDDMRNYDIDDDLSDSDSINASDVEQDDEYGAVDDISDTSDAAVNNEEDQADRTFERQYLRQLRAEEARGTDDIDWNELQIDYESDFGCSDYDICGEDGQLRTVSDLTHSQELLAQKQHDQLNALFPTNSSFAYRTDRWDRKNSDSSGSSSTRSTPVTPDVSRKQSSAVTTRTNSPASPMSLNRDDSETESDDPENELSSPTVSSPKKKSKKPGYRIYDGSVTPKKTPKKRSSKKSAKPEMQTFTVRADKKIRRLLRTMCAKAVYHNSQARLGKSRNGFPFPLTMSPSDLPGSPYSGSESGADSPTWIDMDDAMTNGNTNTGAAITDAINGRIFAEANCSSPGQFHTRSMPTPSFLERLQRRANGSPTLKDYHLAFLEQEDALVPDFDALIAYEECGEPSSSVEQSPMTQLAILSAPVGYLSRRRSAAPAMPGLKEMIEQDKPAASTIVPTTPFSWQGQPSSSQVSSPSELRGPPTSPLSPRKRRLSERSDVNIMSSLTKRRCHDESAATSSFEDDFLDLPVDAEPVEQTSLAPSLMI